MRILCDTHILIWYFSGDERLSAKARELLDDGRNIVYYSLVSVWEIAIKHGRKPDRLTLSAQDFVRFCDEQNFIEYPIRQNHIFTVETLSRSENAPEHNDPFDRLLLAQAKSDGFTFLTHDTLIPYYNEPCVMSV